MPTAPPVHRPRLSLPKGTRAPKVRGSSGERGYTYRWQRLRLRFLMRYPLCAACEASGRTVAANEVDHVIPHRGDQALMWDESNWQALCKPCHSAKTASGL